MLKLIPVVEFEPGFFQSDDRENPIFSNKDTPQDWTEYWENSLADSGIIGIAPYWECSYFVEVSQLTPEIVKILLEKRYENSVESNDFYSLSGGYVLEEGTTFLSTPHCCGSLRDIREWEDGSNWTSMDEMYLWIGHPQLVVSSIDSQHLKITETYEDNRSEDPETFTVDRNELKAAIIDAKKQLDDFKRVLSIAVVKVSPRLTENAIEIAGQLIYA
jgi:hypothetical protein